MQHDAVDITVPAMSRTQLPSTAFQLKRSSFNHTSQSAKAPNMTSGAPEVMNEQTELGLWDRTLAWGP